MGTSQTDDTRDKSPFYRCLILDLDTKKRIVYKVYVNVKEYFHINSQNIVLFT